jgi:hypothetical protein
VKAQERWDQEKVFEQNAPLDAKKGDEKAYVAADNKYVEKGWTSGDQVTWEKQLKTRSQGQDDYVKAK